MLQLTFTESMGFSHVAINAHQSKSRPIDDVLLV